MGGGVDVFEQPDRDPRVEHCAVEQSMAQHRLDEPHIGTTLQHQGRAGMAEQMATARLVDAGGAHISPLGFGL